MRASLLKAPPLMQVAAPEALPAGVEVLVLDCAGARLNMVSLDTIAAFRVRASRQGGGGQGGWEGGGLSMVSLETAASHFLSRIPQVFASMGLFYPERLAKAVVVNAPGWFDVPWCVAWHHGMRAGPQGQSAPAAAHLFMGMPRIRRRRRPRLKLPPILHQPLPRLIPGASLLPSSTRTRAPRCRPTSLTFPYPAPPRNL